jgi:hypothetical protein
MTRDFRDQRSWRFIPAYGYDDDTVDPESRYRTVVFPLLFWGRDPNEEPYFAVFPLGGRVHDILRRDRIVFVLFPLYAHSTVGEMETTDVLWPVFSRSEGPDVSRWRVFPFCGKSVKAGRWSKTFVLWPIWTSAHYDMPGEKGGGFVLFPLFGHVELPDQETWMAVPPFFRWSRAADRREVNCPWPFFQYARGPVDKLYAWPLWGRKSAPGLRSTFALWPVFSWAEIERPDERIERFMALPLVFHERVASSGVGVKSRHFKLWPLFSYHRQGDSRQFRTLALWPGKGTGSIERNYAPLWTLYSSRRVEEERESELLWGLYRHRRGPDGGRVSVFPLFSLRRAADGAAQREWSVLLGLAGYRRRGPERTYRLLYLLRFTTGTGAAAE